MDRKKFLATLPEDKRDRFINELCSLLHLDPDESYGPSVEWLFELISSDIETLLRAATTMYRKEYR